MRVAVAALLLLALLRPAAAERLVTDSAGREVMVPDRIERVLAAGPPAAILLYILAPDGPPDEVLHPARLETVYGVGVTIERLASGHTVCAPDLGPPRFSSRASLPST